MTVKVREEAKRERNMFAPAMIVTQTPTPLTTTSDFFGQSGPHITDDKPDDGTQVQKVILTSIGARHQAVIPDLIFRRLIQFHFYP